MFTGSFTEPITPHLMALGYVMMYYSPCGGACINQCCLSWRTLLQAHHSVFFQSMVAFLKDPSGPPLWEENPEAKDVIHIETEKVSDDLNKLLSLECVMKKGFNVNVQLLWSGCYAAVGAVHSLSFISFPVESSITLWRASCPLLQHVRALSSKSCSA